MNHETFAAPGNGEGSPSPSSSVNSMSRPEMIRKTSSYNPTTDEFGNESWESQGWRDKTASDIVRETPGTLVVEVLAGRQLIARDMVGLFRSKKSDPFVVVSVDGEKIGKTRTKSRTLDPEWESEQFSTYCEPRSTKRITLAVKDEALLTRDNRMGDVYVEVAELCAYQGIGSRVEAWFDLLPTKRCPETELGQLKLAICFTPEGVETNAMAHAEYVEQMPAAAKSDLLQALALALRTGHIDALSFMRGMNFVAFRIGQTRLSSAQLLELASTVIDAVEAPSILVNQQQEFGWDETRSSQSTKNVMSQRPDKQNLQSTGVVRARSNSNNSRGPPPVTVRFDATAEHDGTFLHRFTKGGIDGSSRGASDSSRGMDSSVASTRGMDISVAGKRGSMDRGGMDNSVARGMDSSVASSTSSQFWQGTPPGGPQSGVIKNSPLGLNTRRGSNPGEERKEAFGDIKEKPMLLRPSSARQLVSFFTSSGKRRPSSGNFTKPPTRQSPTRRPSSELAEVHSPKRMERRPSPASPAKYHHHHHDERKGGMTRSLSMQRLKKQMIKGGKKKKRRSPVRRQEYHEHHEDIEVFPEETVPLTEEELVARRIEDRHMAWRCWARSMVRADPRHQIAEFFEKPLDASGEDEHFAVFRPTSNDAIRKMILGRATGKGLNVKGKSAREGALSGYVPFVQIHEEAHKKRVGVSPKHARIRVYFQSVALREQAIKELEPLMHEMITSAFEAEEVLHTSSVEDVGDTEELFALLQQRVSDPRIIELDEFEPATYGLDVAERLFREGFIIRNDIVRRNGVKGGPDWKTGRASMPAFMDANFTAARSTSGSAPKTVVYQFDAENAMNACGLLVAYEESRVLPVASDFDAFTFGSKGMSFEDARLPTEQMEVLNWSIDHIKVVLDEEAAEEEERRKTLEERRMRTRRRRSSQEHMPEADLYDQVEEAAAMLAEEEQLAAALPKSWTHRWLSVLKTEGRKGFHPTLPPFGFGDDLSYSIVEKLVEATSATGAIRHGPECFNYYFPQELDDSYLVVWKGFASQKNGKKRQSKLPYKYLNRKELLEWLLARIEDGYSFPLNPKWVLVDEGWYDIMQALKRKNPESLKVWFPQATIEAIEATHARHNSRRRSAAAAHIEDDDDLDLADIEHERMETVNAQMQKDRVKFRLALLKKGIQHQLVETDTSSNSQDASSDEEPASPQSPRGSIPRSPSRGSIVPRSPRGSLKLRDSYLCSDESPHRDLEAENDVVHFVVKEHRQPVLSAMSSGSVSARSSCTALSGQTATFPEICALDPYDDGGFEDILEEDNTTSLQVKYYSSTGSDGGVRMRRHHSMEVNRHHSIDLHRTNLIEQHFVKKERRGSYRGPKGSDQKNYQQHPSGCSSCGSNEKRRIKKMPPLIALPPPTPTPERRLSNKSFDKEAYEDDCEDNEEFSSSNSSSSEEDFDDDHGGSTPVTSRITPTSTTRRIFARNKSVPKMDDKSKNPKMNDDTLKTALDGDDDDDDDDEEARKSPTSLLQLGNKSSDTQVSSMNSRSSSDKK